MKRKWKLCKWHKLPSYLLIIASYRGEKFNLDRNYYWVYVRRGRKWFQLELSSRVALIKPGGKRASCVHSDVTYSNKIRLFLLLTCQVYIKKVVLFMCQMCTTSVCCSYHRCFAILRSHFSQFSILKTFSQNNLWKCVYLHFNNFTSFTSSIRLTSFIWFARRLCFSEYIMYDFEDHHHRGHHVDAWGLCPLLSR